MIDLHTHSLLSDGELLPTEMARRAEDKGLKVIAITDHVDSSNIEVVIPALIKVCAEINKVMDILIIPGVEITHIPPCLFPDLAAKARQLGAKLILAHGETIVEPVKPGTNLAALKSDIDILAHPGLLTKQEAEIAKNNGIALEISARYGACLTNGHLINIAIEVGANLILNTDAHSDKDLINVEMAKKIARGAGIKDFESLLANSEAIVNKVTQSLK